MKNVCDIDLTMQNSPMLASQHVRNKVLKVKPVIYSNYTKKQNLAFVAKIFQDAQNSFTKHISHSKAILKRFPDCAVLFQYLEPFIRLIIVQEKISPAVSRSVKFLVKIATCVSNGKEFSDNLVQMMLQHCMKYWNSKNKYVRWQICNLSGTILNELDEDQEIDDELWTDLQKRLLFRLKDKMPQVRQSAATALNRLQEVELRMQCPIQQGLIELIDHDKNKAVRLEALKRIDLNEESLFEIYRRLRDRDSTVRAFTYQRLSKVQFNALGVKERVSAMKTGLKDRSSKVRELASNLVIHHWFSSVDGNILTFIEMMDPEQYESECELVVKHILSNNVDIVCDPPPYHLEELNVQSVLYWRILVDFLHEREDSERLDRVLPTLSEYTELLKEVKHTEFICWQLLKFVDHLEWFDEFGKTALTEELLSMLKDSSLSNELVPFVAKVLRKCITDEDEFIRQIIETVVNEIRDPIGEKESEDVVLKKKLLVDQLQSIYNMRDTARAQKKAAVEEERFDDAKIAKKAVEDFSTHISILEEELMKLQRGDQHTWKRVLTIIGDLLEYTKKPVTHPFLQPLLGTTLTTAIAHEDVEIREPGLLALGLYCLLDKKTAKSHMTLFHSVLEVDQLAMKYLALKIVFDIFMVFNFVEEKKEQDPASEEGWWAYPEVISKVISMQKTFLNHSDQDILACAVEGFCKLLFLDRLPKDHLDVLCHLILLFFNARTEENEHIRQILAMFFPYYVNLKDNDGKYGNRELVAVCFMPCLRTISYANVDSPFCNVNIVSFAEFMLTLLTDDISELKKLEKKDKVSINIFKVHENVAFDVLFEIEAILDMDNILPFCRVLAILTINPNNQLNVKQYKLLLDRVMKKVKKKNCLFYLRRFGTMLQKADKKPDEKLSFTVIQELEDRKEKAVEKARQEYADYKRLQERGSEAEMILPQKPNRRKRKKLQGPRLLMDTSEDKPRKKMRVKAPEHSTEINEDETTELQIEPPGRDDILDTSESEMEPETRKMQMKVEPQGLKKEPKVEPKKNSLKTKSNSDKPPPRAAEKSATILRDEDLDEVDKFIASMKDFGVNDPLLEVLSSDSDKSL